MSEPRPLSVFRTLMEEARRLGAKELHFTVDLDDYREDDGKKRWTCHATLEPGLPNKAVGRTGEEALREMVKFLGALACPG